MGNFGVALLFHKYLWNQYDSVLAGLPRSNNQVEGWHNGFQTLIGIWDIQPDPLDVSLCLEKGGEPDVCQEGQDEVG